MKQEEVTPMLLLTLDPGTTDTKICYRLSEERGLSSFQLLLMNSLTTTASRQSLAAYEEKRLMKPVPELEAWIKYDNEYYVTGFLAQRFGAVVDKKALKYEGAITKVLAAVGIIAHKEELGTNLDLALAIVLPYSEWQDRDKIQQELEVALFGFGFREREFSVNLEYFKCIPEGGGLMLTRGQKLGASFNRAKIVALMWGYRDLSVIESNQTLVDGRTVKLGLMEMLEQIQRVTSGLEKKELLDALHSAGGKITSNKMKTLAKSQHPKRKAAEAIAMAKAIKVVRAEYWQMVMKWLLMEIPRDSQEVVIGGGTAYYFQKELEDFMVKNYRKTKVFWSADLEKDVQSVFELDPDRDRYLCVRLADAYGLFRYMQHQVLRNRSPILTKG